MFWRLVDSRELNRLPGDLIAVAAVRHTLDPDQYETPQPTLTFSLSIVRTGRVELLAAFLFYGSKEASLVIG
jgi:hypothetical protein